MELRFPDFHAGKEIIMNLIEQKRNLFTVDSEYVLAHCISADCTMNAGTARDLTKHYTRMRETIRRFEPSLFNAVPYIAPDNRKIYNLVTKLRHFDRPNMESLRYALIDMCNQMQFRGERYLAMPRIGCGLDRLAWCKVREEIRDVFRDHDTSILVCYF
jgi:hypothetical protein